MSDPTENQATEAAAAEPIHGEGEPNGGGITLQLEEDEEEDKGHTFRKRRLSLTNLRQYDQESNGNEVMESPGKKSSDDRSAASNEEKGHTFRKRRLSLTHKRHSDEEDSLDASNKRHRRGSECSVDTLGSNGTAGNNLKSRTVHAAELLAHPPPSPATHHQEVPKLYQQAAPPQQQQPLLDTLQQQPKWKKRHTRHDDKSLPFPRDIVGTFSCHGVEPIYDSDYEPQDEEDDEDDDWVVGNGSFGGGKKLPDIPETEKPTMAAKINQDRGGVAFPYGNCAKTALFAVYDGRCRL